MEKLLSWALTELGPTVAFLAVVLAVVIWQWWNGKLIVLGPNSNRTDCGAGAEVGDKGNPLVSVAGGAFCGDHKVILEKLSAINTRLNEGDQELKEHVAQLVLLGQNVSKLIERSDNTNDRIKDVLDAVRILTHVVKENGGSH